MQQECTVICKRICSNIKSRLCGRSAKDKQSVVHHAPCPGQLETRCHFTVTQHACWVTCPRTGLRVDFAGSLQAATPTQALLLHAATYPLSIGGKLAVEQEALHPCLQAGDVQHFHKVALHDGQLPRVSDPFVLRMLPLHMQLAQLYM